jgi:hypothetical protein
MGVFGSSMKTLGNKATFLKRPEGRRGDSPGPARLIVHFLSKRRE